MENQSTLRVDGKIVNVIWQPKYMEPRAGVWLLQQKLNEYDREKNHDVYITFERDVRYGFSGRVFLVAGGSRYIAEECELFHHEGTGFSYYLIPVTSLVEVFDVVLPPEFLARVEAFKRLHESKET